MNEQQNQIPPLRADNLWLLMSHSITSQVAAWVAVGVATALFGMTPLLPKQWRIIPLLSMATAASVAKALSNDAAEFRRYHRSAKVVSANAWQENLMTQMSMNTGGNNEVTTAAPDMVLFDWNKLRVTFPNENFKPRLIVAPTGSGKTTLIQFLSELFYENDKGVANMLVASSKLQIGQFPNIPTFGYGNNFGNFNEAQRYSLKQLLSLTDPKVSKGVSIAEVLIAINADFRKRSQLYTSGQYLPTVHLFLDEWRDIQNQTKPDGIAGGYFRTWSTLMRSYFMVPYLITQLENAVSIGFEGEAGLKSNFDIILGGSAAVKQAQELASDQSLTKRAVWFPEWTTWIENQRYPWLVFHDGRWHPAKLPHVPKRNINKQIQEWNDATVDFDDEEDLGEWDGTEPDDTHEDLWLQVKDLIETEGLTKSEAIKTMTTSGDKRAQLSKQLKEAEAYYGELTNPKKSRTSTPSSRGSVRGSIKPKGKRTGQ